MLECRRCGRCCYTFDGIKCRHLLFFSDGTTACRIYSRRLGYQVTKGWFCALRENMPVNYPNCPYNKPGQRLVTDVLPNKYPAINPKPPVTKLSIPKARNTTIETRKTAASHDLGIGGSIK